MKYSSYVQTHGLGRMSHKSKAIALEILTDTGKTYDDIAAEHGVSRQRIGQIARRLDIGRITRGQAAVVAV